MRFASLSFFAAALAAPALVAAQAASSTSGAAAPQSTYIPTSGISTTCTGFLESLNSDDNLATCIAPLSNATDFYAQATRGANPSQTALSEGLDKLCTDGDKCDVAAIRKRLFDFFDQCKPEIQQKNEAVLKLYDFLYLIIPFHQAVCTKGDDGKFCLLNTATSAATSAKTKRDIGTDDELLSGVKRSHEHAALHARQAASVDSTVSSTSASNNIAFLFLQPTAKKEVLCSSCTKNILAAYIAFETSIPYAIGLANSDQLKGQSDLYKASQKECGKDFSKQINVVAGTTDFAKVSSALSLPVASTVAAGLSAIAALGLAL